MFNYFNLSWITLVGECMQIYADMIKCNMVDAIVSTGVTIVADIGKKEKKFHKVICKISF